MTEMLIAWLVWAASAFMAFVALVACCFSGADRAGRRAALAAIVLSAGVVIWVVTLKLMSSTDADSATPEPLSSEWLLEIAVPATPCVGGIICLLTLNRRNRAL